MTADPVTEEEFSGGADHQGEGGVEAADEQRTTALAIASFSLSAVGFLTLLKLADRRDRSPAKALGLFLATSLESTGGTALGLAAAGKSSDRMSKGFLLAAAGAVLGIITTALNINWMRTRRRV